MRHTTRFLAHSSAYNSNPPKFNYVHYILDLIADTGATGHYFTPALSAYLPDIKPDQRLVIRLPDQSTIRSSHSGHFDHPLLPLQARKAYIFPDLQASLLSVSTLCDHGCVASFNKDEFAVLRHGRVIISGANHGNLWYCQLPSPASSSDPPEATSTTHPSPRAWATRALRFPRSPIRPRHQRPAHQILPERILPCAQIHDGQSAPRLPGPFPPFIPPLYFPSSV